MGAKLPKVFVSKAEQLGRHNSVKNIPSEVSKSDQSGAQNERFGILDVSQVFEGRMGRVKQVGEGAADKCLFCKSPASANCISMSCIFWP